MSNPNGHIDDYPDDDEPGTFYQYVYDALPDDDDEDFEPNEDTEMFCDWDDEDEIEDAEISAVNWCECGLPRAACHLHCQNEDAS